MIVKQKAAPSARSGTSRVFRLRFTRSQAAVIHIGVIAMPHAAHVEGLSIESGMCIMKADLR